MADPNSSLGESAEPAVLELSRLLAVVSSATAGERSWLPVGRSRRQPIVPLSAGQWALAAVGPPWFGLAMLLVERADNWNVCVGSKDRV